jgi:hypothetical protein
MGDRKRIKELKKFESKLRTIIAESCGEADGVYLQMLEDEKAMSMFRVHLITGIATKALMKFLLTTPKK